MSNQIILSLGIGVGATSLLLGLFISFRSYIQTKSLIESQIARAENELKTDLREVSSMELVKTESGQQLNFILQKEYAERWNRPPEYTMFMFENGSFTVKSKFQIPFSILMDLFMFLGVISPKQTVTKPIDRKKDE